MGEDLRPKWWSALSTGEPIGYGTRRGKTKTHISVSTPTGPGAFRWSAMCETVLAISVIDSGIDIYDEHACRRLLTSRASHGPHQLDLLVDSAPAISRLPWCQECLRRAERIMR